MSLGGRAVDLLQRLIRIDTVNPPGNERPAQEMLRDLLADAGFDCELLGAVAARPNLVARLRGRSDGPRLCLLGHADTVLANPDEWTVDPWSGELRDGFVWGRGALDMKGQVACEVAAAAELGRSGWRPESGELLVVITCDEEAGAELGAKWLCETVPEKVRCDMVLNEGGGQAVDFQGRRLYSLCVGEKGVFGFKLVTEGRAGHASMPAMGDNALLRMATVLARLGDRQPPPDDDDAARRALEAVLDEPVENVGAALERVRAADPRLAEQLQPMIGVTLAPTMIRASPKDNVIPSRCSVRVDCRVPPGMGADHVRARVEELIGREREGGYRLEQSGGIVGNSSPAHGALAEAIEDFVSGWDPGARTLPFVMPGFTDSHWFRRAFPECVAYGFFPQRAMTMFETGPLIHAPDERLALEDVELASGFFRDIPPRVLA